MTDWGRLSEWFSAHAAPLVLYARQWLDRSSAEDVVQEAFAGLHRRWNSLASDEVAIGYLRTSVVNGARSMLRRRRTARNYTPHPLDWTTEDAADSSVLLAEEHREVLAALKKLPARQREVIVLRYWAELPEAEIDEVARTAVLGPLPTPAGVVAVVGAGTGDLPVMSECARTVRVFGSTPDLVVDVGVAGLHRVLGRLDLLRRARVVVVAAGMDGALPSVVAGLVAVPVIALPTSVGYGAALQGVAALLTMLNACAPGIGVVNIDNGYGAGVFAARVARNARARGTTPPDAADDAAAGTEHP